MKAALLACIALAGSAACAHDSWLGPVQASGASQPALALATGNRFPRVEFIPQPDTVKQSGCVDGTGSARHLAARGPGDAGLLLEAPALPAYTCWVELHDFDVELTPQLVDAYLPEVRPAPEVLARWDMLRSAGRVWQERYGKFAATEVSGPDTTAQQFAAMRTPRGVALEVVARGSTALRAGEIASFDVMSEGKRVAAMAVELVGARSGFGLWSRTDAEGRVSWRLPYAGQWLVRAIRLEPAGESAWKSRFATFTFEALAASR